MNPPRDFDKDVKDAAVWEKLLAEKIVSFMRNYIPRLISYDNPKDIELQRKGMDLIVSSDSAIYEIKTRAHKYYRQGILLEIMSVVQHNKLGWLYTSEADCIAYVWLNESGTNLEPIGYFLLLKELRKTKWYAELPGVYHVMHTSSFRKTPNGMSNWTTEFIVPEIDDFPRFPIKTLFQFNAILPSNYKQMIFPVGEGREDE